MEDYVLEAKGITKRFPLAGVIALSNISFHVKKGEILGLIGENGAGKSTLLKILNGVYTYGNYEGELFHEGRPVRFRSSHDAMKQGLGYVPQEINVMEDLTVAENVFVGHLNEDSRKKSFRMGELNRRAQRFLSEHHFALDPAQVVNTMSIGQKQLLMVAKAISWNPSILVLDEPTTALSQADVENLFAIVRQLKSKGTSVIFVTHKLEEIFELTDRVTILRDGKVINTYGRDQYDRDRIICDMVGREITNLYPERHVAIGEEILKVEHLTVLDPRIQNRNIVEDVSFTLRRGECLGFVGLVGAGRTETISALFGCYRDYSAKVAINGQPVEIRSEADAIAHGINILTEDRKMNGLLLLNNIRFNVVMSNLKKIMNSNGLLSRTKEDEESNKYMRKLHIKAPSNTMMVANLSGGNQQKVVMAKALHSDPRILLLDEPTKGIDVGSKQEIYEIINELLGEGISIIMISSELPELIGMCDRFIVLSHGKLVAEIDKEEATQETLMSACFM
ncbi:MAG: sugar ABC transporter ATP-binding protein [Clostridia bacterium]|nr:sugar ABC transporter ATP-binding protein [Clostridia bacterium]